MSYLRAKDISTWMLLSDIVSMTIAIDGKGEMGQSIWLIHYINMFILLR